MGAVVFADPLMGYGNNGDFRRIQSCFGLWPQGVETIAAGQHAQMPAAQYRYHHPYSHDHCYWSSGLALFGAAILARPVPDWLAITALIGGMGHLRFAVSLLGDGYTDLARHNYCYQTMLAIGLIAAAVVLLRALSSAAQPSAF